jgi:hypothetical protein
VRKIFNITKSRLNFFQKSAFLLFAAKNYMGNAVRKLVVE